MSGDGDDDENESGNGKPLSQHTIEDYFTLYDSALSETWGLLDSIFNFQFKQTLAE